MTRVAAPARCVVRIYFCTASTCARAATTKQIAAISRRLRGEDGVASVRFVSKKEALRIMRRRYPDAAADLPANPFPDSLRVRPFKGVPPGQVAAGVRAGARGVHAVHFARDRSCG